MEVIAGVDEAGRGPLIGSVVAACVVLDPANPIDGLNDSKKLSEAKREKLFDLIQARSLDFAIAEATPEEIDTLNILQATMLAMRRAVLGLKISVHKVYVDGNRVPELPYPAEAIIGGDAKVAAISAASILAKVARDRAMVELDRLYPGYGIAQHKGYPTKVHMEALQALGPTPHHRRSFRPVRECLPESA